MPLTSRLVPVIVASSPYLSIPLVVEALWTEIIVGIILE